MTDPERHFRVQDLLGVYILEAVEEAERRDVEDHLQHCDVCRKELADLGDAVSLLPERPETSDELWKRIMAQVRDRRTGSEPGGADDTSACRCPSTSARRWLASSGPAGCESPTVFTTVRAPHRDLTSGGVSAIVRAACGRAACRS